MYDNYYYFICFFSYLIICDVINGLLYRVQLHLLNQQEPGVILFRSDTMQFRVSLDPSYFQSLHIKITPAMENQIPWSQEELQVRH